MRVFIQELGYGKISITGKIESQIDSGLLVFLGVEDASNEEDIKWLRNKVVDLRIFDNENKVPNF